MPCGETSRARKLGKTPQLRDRHGIICQKPAFQIDKFNFELKSEVDASPGNSSALDSADKNQGFKIFKRILGTSKR